MTIKRALVTGGAGFIGSHIVDALLERWTEVFVYDNFSTGRPENTTDQVTYIHRDIKDYAELKLTIRECDFVFHCAANADVRGGMHNTNIDLRENVLSTWNVLEAMRQTEIKNIAFCSSAVVYGEPDVFPTPETYAGIQTSLYGASKLACEAMIQAYCEYFGMRCWIFRFVSWIGERYHHGVIVDFVNKLKRDSTKLEILGNGLQKKSYLYVKDGVDAIMLAIDKATDQKNIFNLGHDETCTVVQLADILCDELGMRDTVAHFTGGDRGWIGDSPCVHLDTTRIKSLGWKPTTSIEEGIRRTVRYIKRK